MKIDLETSLPRPHLFLDSSAFICVICGSVSSLPSSAVQFLPLRP
jgi:hypothetical protein